MSLDYSHLLNPAQLQAVETSAQHVRVIAGAGSGKTRVLTYRIAYLIEHEQVDPERILAVTFTNKAAQEMKNRVVQLVPDASLFLSVSTFHSFCARFLRKEAHAINYPSGFTIFDEEDQEKLVKNIASDNNYKKGDPIVKESLKYIRGKKEQGIYPEDIVIEHESFMNEKKCLKFYAEYENRKRMMTALDFDDLILQTVKILKENEEIHEMWSHHFDHILIDEFQDTNDQEYELIKLLMQPSTALYVVGDPDQTIYTWRGANQGIILGFPHNFPDYQDVVLNENYRSTKNILDAANRLIAHNKKRVPKDLYTEQDGGSAVTAKRFPAAEDEAKWVIEKIESLSRSTPFSHIAVLYRASYLTRPFESEFASHGIPYRIFGGLRFYQRKEVKDVLAYFRLLLNPLDDVSFERIANVPKRSIGETSLEKIRDAARSEGVSEYNYCLDFTAHPDAGLSPRVRNALTLMISKMEACKKKLTDNLEVYSAVLKDFITDLGYYEYITEDQGVDEDRAGNVNALFDDINHFIQNHPESTFEEYLQNVSLLTSQDDMNEGDYVSLMTIHVAKGLEFDNVFIIGMNDGAFPSSRSQEERGRDGMEEERRLCYVAMTRAKQNLFMTCNSSYSYATDSHGTPSIFFEEAGLKLPKDPGYQAYSPYGGRKPSYGGEKVVWKNIPNKPYSDVSFYADGPAISPFEEKQEEKPASAPTNGIEDWSVGDRCHHEKFGDGTVVDKLNQSIIVVKFDDGSEKKLLATHKMLSRIAKKGGQA